MSYRNTYWDYYNKCPGLLIYDDIIGENKVNPREFPYQVKSTDFKTLPEAEAFAKRKHQRSTKTL